MAQIDLENFTDRGLLIAASDTTLLPGTHALQILDGSSELLADESEQNVDSPYLTNVPTSYSNFRRSIGGTVLIAPPTAPGHATNGIAPITPALLPCGLSLALNALLRTSVLTPVSTAMVAADAKWYHAGTVVAPEDMRGDLSALTMEIGQPFKATLKLEGKCDLETQEALPDFDFSDFLIPTTSTYDNSTLVINSLGPIGVTALSLWGQKMVVNFGQTVETIELTEHIETAINARKGTFEAIYARPDYDDLHAEALWRTKEHITLDWTTRETDGRYTRLSCRGQITKVEAVNFKGKRCEKITGRCIKTAANNSDYGVSWGDFTFALNGTLNGGSNGDAYVANGLTPSGTYVTPLAWSISAGTLPAGLTINATTGVISGTPTETITSAITVRAEDSTSGTPKVATKAVSIVVTA